jgi:hypothetical protein
MKAIYIVAAVIALPTTIYFAVRSREFRKFLAGAFFMTSGILFYLYLAGVSLPLLGTDFVQTPRMALGRSIAHFVFFLLTFYFGFIRKPSGVTPRRASPATTAASGT